VIRALLLWLALTMPAAAETRQLVLASPLPALPELVVRGENPGANPAILVLRVDDRAHPAYADRANIERLIPPGPFTARLRLPLLATSGGRALEMARLTRAIAHAPEGRLRLHGIAIEGAPALPQGVHGWSFAPQGAAPLAGMEAVAPDDPRLQGNTPRFVRRPGEDPILARGMNGVTRFAAALPPGRWNLTLWTEDPGEWETLPALLEQRIRVNGRDVVLFRRSQAEWVAQRYLAGRDAPEGGTPWAAIGARRGGRVEAEVTLAPGEELVVELAGHPRASTHLSALLAEPGSAGRAALEALREVRFAETWPVLAPPPVARSPALTVTPPPPAIAAPGGVAVLRFTATGPHAMPLPATWAWEGAPLPTRLLWGQWRWRRPAPETAGLVLSPAHLHADLDALTLPDGLPREVLALVTLPPDAAPGPRRLRLRLGDAEAEAVLDVLPSRRPAPAAQVGVFLDFAPHLDAGQARAQAACDLAELARLGFSLSAPPLATPEDATGRAALLADLRAAGGGAPLIAYTPLRRLEAHHGPAEAARRLGAAIAAIAESGLPQPVWVAADEPSAHGGADRVRALAAALRAEGVSARLAGHLNDPADAALLPLLHLVTVNPRFGADAADIARLRAAGVRPFLYNMPRLRLAAGFFLWRSGAEGLLQWHARMPTADPFDPTDGREGDVQFLWPTPGLCAPPDLDADLLELAEGVEDLRWLAWLDSAPGAEAAALRARLWREVPATWQAATALPPGAPQLWQNAITGLARRLP